MLILALLNISFLHLALASSTTSPRSLKANPVSTFAVETDSEPVPEPSPAPHATKDDIKKDLDDTNADFQSFVGADPNGAAATLFRESGLDPAEDVDDAKHQVDEMTDDDFTKSQGQFDKMHTKFNKRKKKMALLLSNPVLMDLLHRPLPQNFRIVARNSGTAVPGIKRVSVSTTKGLSPWLPSTKAGTAPVALVRGLAGLSVTIVPGQQGALTDIDGQCNPGGGFPQGAGGVAILSAVALATEIVKESIPHDTLSAPAHLVVAIVWGIAKGIELAVDMLHTVYIECRTEKGLEEIKTEASEIKTSVSEVKTEVSEVKTSVGEVKTSVGEVKTSVGDINPHTDVVRDAIIDALKTKIADGATKTTDAVNKTTDAVTTSTTTITNTLANVDKNINDSRGADYQ